jgi:hypothetical protein
MLDVEEFADALADGAISVDVAVDGLWCWQAFLTRYLYTEGGPVSPLSDVPTREIDALAAIAEPARAARHPGGGAIQLPEQPDPWVADTGVSSMADNRGMVSRPVQT